MCEGCIQQFLQREKISSDNLRPWHMCIKCRKRMVYYRVYGLCLHCAADEFAGISAPVQDVVLPEALNVPLQHEEEAPFSPNGNLELLISGLDEVAQTVMTLRHQESYSMERIGHLLGLSGKTVSEIYSRAVQSIKDSGMPPHNQERMSHEPSS
jgi:DNA-directed RNA polymerase specialized sigma24 family protein